MPTPHWQTAAQIQTLFNDIAPIYDQLNQDLSYGLHWVWKGMTVRWARPPRGGTVLDTCCGSGDLAQLLARRVGRRGRVVGLDFSAHLLALAQTRAQSRLPGYRLQWIQGDTLALPFPDNCFDAVTMGYGLRNVTDVALALSEIQRVLKPGAWAGILDFNQPEDPWLHQLQSWYLTHRVVPCAAQQGLSAHYAYIAPSLEQFLSGLDQCRVAQQVGFQIPHYYPLMGGLMGVLVLQKGS